MVAERSKTFRRTTMWRFAIFMLTVHAAFALAAVAQAAPTVGVP
jgi:hypothetical protein